MNNDRKNIIHGIHDLPDGYAPWIVKFSNTQDSADAGAIEYVYALIAKKSGISMPDVHLFLAQKGAGYFAFFFPVIPAVSFGTESRITFNGGK